MSLKPQEFRRLDNNGKNGALSFPDQEYLDRLSDLRDLLELHDLDAVVLTSRHNVAYYSGFLCCSFGRPYVCVVTKTDCVTISAGTGAGQPFRRSIGDSINYTVWAPDNMWRAVASVTGTGTGKAVGCEANHLTLEQAEKFNTFLRPKRGMDIAPATMQQRMTKSPAEIALITQAAAVADVGGHAIRAAIRVGATELELSHIGRDAMEREIALRFPDAENRDTKAWFQSGLNTNGAYGRATNRKLQRGDILSLNCCPMINGYGAALGRTLFLGEADDASLAVWQTTTDTLEFGKHLLRPGATCAEITSQINAYLADRQMLEYRLFGYGHGVGILSNDRGHEAALDLREDNDTVLEPGMVISLQPTLTIPAGRPGAGGYRENGIFVVTEDTPEEITDFPVGPAFNVVG